jgi:hypothetical protein
MPFRAPEEGPALLVRLSNAEERLRDARYRGAGWLGLTCLIAGAILQIAGVTALR